MKGTLGKTVSFFGMALLGMLFVVCHANAMEQAGDVKTVSGTVHLVREGALLVPAVGDALQVTDTLRTGADGSIGISFVDGTRLSLGPSSEAALQDYVFEPLAGDFAFGLEIVKGSMAYVTGKIGKLAPAVVKITTPTATIGIRGTSFVLKVD